MAINHIGEKKGWANLKFPEIIHSLLPVLKSWYFYIGLASLVIGVELNFLSQTYLYQHFSEGRALPQLSDLILDPLPLYDVSILYDLFSFIPCVVFVIYIVHRKEYNRIPFFLFLCGLIEIVRGIFIILTPLGNPPMFTGSDTVFNGFSLYELGVYPSGHVGNVFLLFLLVKERGYRYILFFCLLIVIGALFLAHAHYSIDILSGLLFAYAVQAFGENNLTMFNLGTRPQPASSDSARQTISDKF